MVGYEGVRVFIAEVYRNRNNGKRLLQRKRSVLARGEFATREEAYAFTQPYFLSGYGTQIISAGYYPNHPIDAAHDEHLIFEAEKQAVKDYFGDDYEGWRWEEQHAEMVRAEEAKRKRRDNVTKDNGAPF